jgi:Fe-S-cluster containining protein
MSKSNGKDTVGGGPLELPLLELPGSHPCYQCGDCCHYVAVEIDDPTSFADLDNVHWYLAHRDISVYVDWEGDWFIEFKTSCESLTEQITCGIYEDRPQICSDFLWSECERTTQERAWKYRFTTPEEFVAWHREKRPRSLERYLKSRQKMKQRREGVREQATSRGAAPARGARDRLSETAPS